jgi:hypothetical protein
MHNNEPLEQATHSVTAAIGRFMRELEVKDWLRNATVMLLGASGTPWEPSSLIVWHFENGKTVSRQETSEQFVTGLDISRLILSRSPSTLRSLQQHAGAYWEPHDEQVPVVESLGIMDTPEHDFVPRTRVLGTLRELKKRYWILPSGLVYSIQPTSQGVPRFKPLKRESRLAAVSNSNGSASPVPTSVTDLKAARDLLGWLTLQGIEEVENAEGRFFFSEAVSP